MCKASSPLAFSRRPPCNHSCISMFANFLVLLISLHELVCQFVKPKCLKRGKHGFVTERKTWCSAKQCPTTIFGIRGRVEHQPHKHGFTFFALTPSSNGRFEGSEKRLMYLCQERVHLIESCRFFLLLPLRFLKHTAQCAFEPPFGFLQFISEIHTQHISVPIALWLYGRSSNAP